jgi:hypothetical protein
MIPIEELDPEKMNKDFTEEERERIKTAAALIFSFDDIMIFVGKRLPNERTATTAIIFAKETFRGQVAERLLKELPGDWRKNLTANAEGLTLIAALRQHWMAFLNGVSPSVTKNIEESFNKLEEIFRFKKGG